jgi:hypothetical protein
MNTGRKALNMTADDLEARMRDMSPFEKQMFALGARRAMAETISSKGDTANVINAITGTGKKRAMLARLFGDRPTFNRFVQTLNQEKEGFRTYARALSGSPTALNLEDDATLKFASVAADMAANGGIPVATAVRQAVKFGIGKIGDKTKQQVAALLSETDPARFKELAAQLREEATRRGLFKRKVTQPIRTIAGYPDSSGSPAQIYTVGKHSIRVRNAAGEQVFYSPSAGVSEAANSGDPYYVHCSFLGDAPGTSQVIAKHVFPVAVSFEADLPGGVHFNVGTNPDSDTDFDMRKNGVSYGTLTIDATGDTTVECDAQDFDADDWFTLVSPDTVTAAANIAGTIDGAVS